MAERKTHIQVILFTQLGLLEPAFLQRPFPIRIEHRAYS